MGSMITSKSLDAAANAFTEAENRKGIVSLGDKLEAAILAYLETPSGVNPCNQPIAHNEAKNLLRRMGYDMVIIVATNDTDIIGSSYGKSNHDCMVAQGMLRSIMDKIDNGDV